MRSSKFRVLTGDKNGATLPVVNSFMIPILLTTGSFLALMACWHCLAVPRLRKGPSGDARIELMRIFVDTYARLFHRLQVEGLQNLPETVPKGMLVISNHGSPLDPFLIQASRPGLFIHWMMAKDQMGPDSNGFWRFLGIIPTDRIKGDPAAALAALRLLRRGKSVGLFPEGRLETSSDTLLPFQPGAGTLISLSGAPVLLICVDGTPRTETILAAFFRRSRSRVRIIGLLHFAKGHDPDEITEELRRRFLSETGWDQDDAPEPLIQQQDPFLS